MRNLWLKRAIRAVTKRPFGAGRAIGGYSISGDSILEKTDSSLSLTDSFELIVLDAQLEITDGALAVTEEAFGFDVYNTLEATDYIELQDALPTIERVVSTATLEGDEMALSDTFDLAVLDAELSITDANSLQLTEGAPTIESTEVNNVITDDNDLSLEDLGAALWKVGATLEVLNGDFDETYLTAGLYTPQALPVHWRTYLWHFDSVSTPDVITQTLDSTGPGVDCASGVCQLVVDVIFLYLADAQWQGAGVRQSTDENPALVISSGINYSLGFRHTQTGVNPAIKLAVRIIDSRGYVWDDATSTWSTNTMAVSSLIDPASGTWTTAAITFTGAADGPVAIEMHAARDTSLTTGIGTQIVSIDDITLVEV